MKPQIRACERQRKFFFISCPHTTYLNTFFLRFYKDAMKSKCWAMIPSDSAPEGHAQCDGEPVYRKYKDKTVCCAVPLRYLSISDVWNL